MLADISAVIELAFAEHVSTLLEDKARLASMRAQVDAGQVTVGQMAGVCTSIIHHLIVTLEGIEDFAHTGLRAERVGAYIARIEAKEAAGLERAMGATGFSSGEFSKQVYARMLTLQGAQDPTVKSRTQPLWRRYQRSR
jgi:hypothetical protein